MERHIKFVGLAIDAKIIATYTHWDKDEDSREDYKGRMKQIFESSQWNVIVEQKKSKLELKNGGNVYCLEIDLVSSPSRVFFTVITSNYPTRYIFSSSSTNSSTPRLMKEFRDYCNGSNVSSSLSDNRSARRLVEPYLKTLAIKFEDIESIDKLAAASRKVQDVQKIMAENIAMVSERDSLLSGLEDKSATLKASAKSMFTSSNKLKQKSCRKLWWCYGYIFIGILFAAAAIVLGLNYGVFHWWE